MPMGVDYIRVVSGPLDSVAKWSAVPKRYRWLDADGPVVWFMERGKECSAARCLHTAATPPEQVFEADIHHV